MKRDGRGPGLRAARAAGRLASGRAQVPQQPGRFHVSRSGPTNDGQLAPPGLERGSPPTGGLVETRPRRPRHAQRDRSDPLVADCPSPPGYLSYAVLDSLTGALLSQTVQFTTFRDFSAAMSGFTGRAKDYGSAGASAGHPDVAQ